MKASGHSVFVASFAGTVLFSNRIAQDALGLIPGQSLIGKIPELWPHVCEVFQKHNPKSGVDYQAGDSSYRAFLEPIRFPGTPLVVLCVLEDRNEIETIAKKMRAYFEMSQDLDAMISSSSDGLWICDANATVLRINKASERINKVSEEEVVGRTMFDLVDEGFIDKSATLEVIKTRSQVNMLQQTQNGRKLMVTGNPVFGEDGALTRIVVNDRDITEIDDLRRELEEQAAIKEEFRHQILERQLLELEANRVIARSTSFVNVLQQALKVSKVDSTVLILGESGAGKGLIADLIHNYSGRADHPMIKINCGAIPESLVEAELFGYEKGAYTGAGPKGKPGQFELADKGIIFLDEIAELPLSAQVKLLRFLEDGQVTRLGGTVSRRVNVRVLCATNQDLEGMVGKSQFRKDLFYRLNVIPIRVPPLRERGDCILPLIHHYLGKFAKKMGQKSQLKMGPNVSNALLSYTYPGNVRELINLCERLAVMCEGHQIDLKDLPVAMAASNEVASNLDDRWTEGLGLNEIISRVEKQVLERTLIKHRTQEKIASVLKVNQSTIARKLKKHGIS
jgi:PAS domain S-box-containing protein